MTVNEVIRHWKRWNPMMVRNLLQEGGEENLRREATEKLELADSEIVKLMVNGLNIFEAQELVYPWTILPRPEVDE